MFNLCFWIDFSMQSCQSHDGSWSSTVVSIFLTVLERLTNVFSILFLAAAIISGIDAYELWKSGNLRTQPDIYGQTPSRSSSPEGKDDWSLSTDDLGAKSTYASDAYQGWAQDHEPAFLESDTMEGRHPGKHVRCESTKTIPYERDLTPSAMSPTVAELRYTGIFPSATANYSFSRE